MGQTRQDDTRTELSRPGEPGLTTRMAEKGIQQQPHEWFLIEWRSRTNTHIPLHNIGRKWVDNNTALNKNIIPHTWKLANIVPIPKPNKDTDKGTSYRPISLLSVIAKTLEKSLLPYITANIPNTPMQHGYKTQHSTVTALHTLNNTVASSSSCHQTSVFHLSTHFFAVSLNLLRSSNEQGCSRRVHCIMCAVFSVARPHSQVVSPS